MSKVKPTELTALLEQLHNSLKLSTVAIAGGYVRNKYFKDKYNINLPTSGDVDYIIVPKYGQGISSESAAEELVEVLQGLGFNPQDAMEEGSASMNARSDDRISSVYQDNWIGKKLDFIVYEAGYRDTKDAVSSFNTNLNKFYVAVDEKGWALLHHPTLSYPLGVDYINHVGRAFETEKQLLSIVAYAERRAIINEALSSKLTDGEFI